MGASVSLLANQRQNKIAAEVKEDNARLEARIQSLSEETTRLKVILREIGDSGCETVHGGSVQMLRFKTDLSPFSLPCRKFFIVLLQEMSLI